jgi:hypothetical protein
VSDDAANDNDAERFVLLDASGLAARLGVSVKTAYRRFEAIRARQGMPDVLKMTTIPAPIGSGAIRQKMVVFWPLPVFEGLDGYEDLDAAAASVANDDGRAEGSRAPSSPPSPARSRRRRR